MPGESERTVEVSVALGSNASGVPALADGSSRRMVGERAAAADPAQADSSDLG